MADATFTLMRFNLLTAALNPNTARKLSDAYVYAWSEGVYPVSDGMAEWHEPFADQFRVTREMGLDLLKFLDERWREKQPISFYTLENHYEVSSGYGSWDRGALIHLCRYFRLCRLFDDAFFMALTKNGESPIEAASITDPWNREADLFLM